MSLRTFAYACIACCLAAALPAHAHDDSLGTPGLGTVSFPTSCDPGVQPSFERGVAMLHSFWFTEAGKVFSGVIKEDPGCAIAYWGLAVNLLGNPLASPPSQRDSQAALEAIDKARAIGAKSARERDWIDAIGAYFRDYATTPIGARQQAYAEAMRRMAERYPQDDEVRVYYALALQGAASPKDLTYANQKESARILEDLFARNPRHPGAAHYLIHAYDFPPLATQGLAAASRYASIAPASPHARHMPSHIFTMLGHWEESIASNLAALEVQPDYYHALDFVVYARLQLAQDAEALALIRKGVSDAQTKPPVLNGYKNSVAAMPSRHALERADWKAAAVLPITSNQWAYADSITRFARGIGMARSGDLAGAREEIEALRSLQRDLQAAGQAYWVARVEEEAYAVSGWIESAQGHRAQAEKLLRAAADGEDASVKNVSMENQLYPMREWLAEWLFLEGRADEALREYESALRARPNRLRSLLGALRAAQASGQREAAQRYAAQLRELTRKGDNTRPDLAQALAAIASR